MKPALLTDDMTALPSNAEFDLVNRYTGGRMTEAEAAEFEAMLDDPAFFYRVAPLIKLWYKREPLPIEKRIGDRIAARRAAGLPLYQPTFMERVADATEGISARHVSGLALAAALAFAAFLRMPGAAVTPTKSEVHTAQVSIDSPPPVTKTPAHTPLVHKSVTKSPAHVLASAKPAVAVDTPVTQQLVVVDTALERALSQLIGSPPGVQSAAAAPGDSVTVALNIPWVPPARADGSTSLGQRLRAAVARGSDGLGAIASAIGGAIRSKIHRTRF